MLFTSYVLGFIALATAAPSVRPRSDVNLAERDAKTPAARGLTWTPRSLEAREKSANSYNSLGNSSESNLGAEQIVILKLKEQILAEELLIAEIELSRAIKEEFKAQRELQSAIDNIRKNTCRNQNSNNLDIVIVIITEIIDNRDSKKSNKRYMSRQIKNKNDGKGNNKNNNDKNNNGKNNNDNNNNNNDKNNNNNNNKNNNNNNNNNNNVNIEVVFVVIVESAQMTIGSNVATKTDGAARATGTGEASPSIGTFVPGSELVVQEGMTLFPAGIDSPTFSNGKQSPDPASIILDNQALFVQASDGSISFGFTALRS